MTKAKEISRFIMYRQMKIRVSQGFSLLEALIALVIGLLLISGVLTLFTGTSKVNRVQNGMARLQENGRYAMSRMSDDLVKMAGQFRSNTAGSAFIRTGNGPVYPAVAPRVNAKNLAFSDGIAAGAPTGWPSSTTYPLSPRYFVQGYACDSTSCTPSVPTGTGGFPSEGIASGNRLKGTDVFTVRYQKGTGWPYSVVNTGAATEITLLPYWDNPGDCASGPDDCINIETDNFILVADCSGSTIIQVDRNGLKLTPKNLIDAAQLQLSPGTDSCDPRIFNFTNDFISISYWIKVVADDNISGRVIPALMRRENGVDQEIVRGVERLDYLYGVQYKNGLTAYLSAKELETKSDSANCPGQPAGLPNVEAGCLWRSVKNVEVHALFNTIDDINDLTPIDSAYRYKTSNPVAPTGSVMPQTGLPVGRMIRREFIIFSTVRNYSG